jgi:hypothetical protein
MNNPLLEQIIEKINIERDLLRVRFPLHSHTKEMMIANAIFDKIIDIIKKS